MSETTEETPEMFAARVETAKRAHDEHNKARLAMLPTVITFGAEAIKAAAVVTGGSAAAMLAFIGSGRQAVTEQTIMALGLFGSGFICATVATGAAYMAQFFYHSATDEVQPVWDPPFFTWSLKSKILADVGRVWHGISVLLVLAAYGLAAYGFTKMVGAITPMAAKP